MTASAFLVSVSTTFGRCMSLPALALTVACATGPSATSVSDDASAMATTTGHETTAEAPFDQVSTTSSGVDTTTTTDSGESSTGEPSATLEPNGCEAIAPGRVRCPLYTEADFEAGSFEATELRQGVITLADTGRTPGTDTTNAYNGGSFEYGSFTSAVLESPVPFNAVVPSWTADTPPGTWITVQVRARVANTWTAWYRMGVWASGTTDVQRHSFENESDAYGSVNVDLVDLVAPADAVQIRATLFTGNAGQTVPSIRRLTLAMADRSVQGQDEGGEAWGTAIAVPPFSQMIYPDGGNVWCSPTSITMLSAYWDAQVGGSSYATDVPTAARGTFDHVFGGFGNWPFSVAFAGSRGLVGEVVWLNTMSDIERYIARGIPVAISALWQEGEITNAPMGVPDGHLLVVRGFDENGDVAVNDPAGPDDNQVSRIYDRQELANAWDGVIYVLAPELD